LTDEASDGAGRAGGVLDDHSTGHGVSGVASVLALVGDLVGANLGEVDHVAGDFDLLGDDTVNLIGASGTIVDVVLVEGGLDGHEVVAEDVDDGLGVVLVDEGTALGGGESVAVSAGVLDEVGSRLEGVEGGGGAGARASVPAGGDGALAAAVVVADLLGAIADELDDLDVAGVASGVLDDVVVEAAGGVLDGAGVGPVGATGEAVGTAGADGERGGDGVLDGDLAGLYVSGEVLEVLAAV